MTCDQNFLNADDVPGDPAARFRSHKTFIEALCYVGGKNSVTRNERALRLLARKVLAAGCPTDKLPQSIDRTQVHQCLRNAWSTEVLLALPGEWAKDEDEFMRLSNSWGVVQAYYCGYHVTQALIVAKGGKRPTAHPQTQRQYANLWVDRPLEFAPWTFGVSHSGWKNLPSGVQIDSTVHPWTTCDSDNCWSLGAKVLRSTREEAVKRARETKRDEGQRDRKRAWQQDEAARLAQGKRPRAPKVFPRPQLSPNERQACDQGVRTYTVLDYLYRLRVGANYDDAGIFVDGPDNDYDSYLLHKRVNFLASGLALLSELRIRELVGPTQFYRWADDFIANSIPTSYSVGIKERRSLL